MLLKDMYKKSKCLEGRRERERAMKRQRRKLSQDEL
jgi:hypothetical protein